MKKFVALFILILMTFFNHPEFAQEKLKIATCQFPVTGDMKSNANYIKNFIKEAAENHANIVHFSEAALTGYPAAG